MTDAAIDATNRISSTKCSGTGISITKTMLMATIREQQRVH